MQRGEMRQRIMSAAILATLAIASLFAGLWPFAVLVAGIAAIMAWEWGHVVRREGFDSATIIHAGAVALAVFFCAAGSAALAMILVLAATILIALLAAGGRTAGWLSAAGVPYLGIAAAGLIWLRLDADWGVFAIFFIFCSVWAHDTCAMLIGRAVGGPLLCPAISPKKTWAGLVGGVAAACGVGVIAGLYQGHLIWLTALATAAGLAAFAGDLAESALKRLHNVRHASELIPGHGGFLDRMDGAIAAIVLCVVAALLIDPSSPGRAILNGP